MLNDRWLCVDIINTMLKPRNLALMTEERYQQTFGFPVVDYYRGLGFDFEQEPFEEVAIEFINRYKARQFECDLCENAETILGFCHDLEVTQTILSAMEQEMLNSMVHQYGLGRYFAELVGLPNHFANSKTENGRKHIESLAIQPSQVVFIGDTEHDFDVAAAMGTDIILCADGHHSRARLKATGAPVIDSIRQLPDFFSSA